MDAKGKLSAKPRQLLVIGAKDRDQIISYFEVCAEELKQKTGSIIEWVNLRG